MFEVYLALGILLTALVFFGLWVALSHLHFATYHRDRESAPPPLGLIGTLKYYWRLALATGIVTWWTLRAAGRDGIQLAASDDARPPVLCVHGFFRNGTCMWGIRRALGRRGRSTLAVSMGRPWRSIEHYAPPLEAALRELATSFPGQRIDVVAHSMGGLVLRHVLAEDPDLGAAVGRIVTLGSPHRGTAVVRGLAMAPEHKQLEPGSRFLNELPDFRTCAPDAEVTTVAAERDFIVYPKSTSHLEGARTVDLADANHQSLLTERQAFEVVGEALS